MNHRLLSTCSTCKGDIATPNIYGVCGGCVRAQAVASRRAQGLPPTVTDPVAISLIVAGVKEAARRAGERAA